MSWYWGSQETHTVFSVAFSSETMRARLWVRDACVMTTPLGSDVEPDVYWRNATFAWGPSTGPWGRPSPFLPRSASQTIHFNLSGQATPRGPKTDAADAASAPAFFAQPYAVDVSANRASQEPQMDTKAPSSAVNFFRGSGGNTGTATQPRRPQPRNATTKLRHGS